MIKNNNKIEFGDFQTPIPLAHQMVAIIHDLDIHPDIIIEPTCGIGNILKESISVFPDKRYIGIELNSDYVDILKKDLSHLKNVEIINADIFSYDKKIFDFLSQNSNILLVGNPPWVTNSGIGAINGNNLPRKSNFKNFKGIDAITGKSNFDISEYILLKLIDMFYQRNSSFAFLCKTIVARNILKYIWKKNINYGAAHIYNIDTEKHFNAATNACLFVLDFTNRKDIKKCIVHKSIEDQSVLTEYGFHNNTIIYDVNNFKSYNYFGKSDYIWRNGIKHDCSKVMELRIDNGNYINGYDEIVNIEPDLIYPLLKSSDLAKKDISVRRFVIVTQKYIGESTKYIKSSFPKTWNYLIKYEKEINSRKSSIYNDKPPFSIFSIGDYSFTKYKIAISGLYKNLSFKIIIPFDDKPVMVDDTCNFISCKNIDELNFLYKLLTSSEVIYYLNSIIFWDSKRPITTEVLNSINLKKVSLTLGLENLYNKYNLNQESNLSLWPIKKQSSENKISIFDKVKN